MKDKDISALTFTAINELGPQEVARLVHLVGTGFNNQKIISILNEYCGFITKYFRGKLVGRIFTPIICGFINAYLERRFISLISKFEGCECERFTKEWCEEFHYYYWAYFVNYHSTKISSVCGETSQAEICNALRLFRNMPTYIKEQQFAAFLNILYIYPLKILNKNEIDDLAYNTEEDWSHESLPHNTQPILAKTAYEEMFEMATNACSNLISDIATDDMDIYKRISNAIDNDIKKRGGGDKPLVDRKYILEAMPSTPVTNLLAIETIASKVFY